MKHYDIILFDLDGTLLNTITDIATALNKTLKANGFQEHSLKNVVDFVGNGLRLTLKRALPPENSISNQDFDTLYELFLQNYEKHCKDTTKPYPHIKKLLKQLKDDGIYIGIVSNKQNSHVQELSKMYFGSLVDYTAGEDEKNGIMKKPNPEMVYNALSYFKNLTKKKDLKAVYIGDSEVDIQTAKNAHLDCISVSYGFKNKEFLLKNGATCIANSVKEISALIANSSPLIYN